jgi:hypothetical protein
MLQSTFASRGPCGEKDPRGSGGPDGGQDCGVQATDRAHAEAARIEPKSRNVCDVRKEERGKRKGRSESCGCGWCSVLPPSSERAARSSALIASRKSRNVCDVRKEERGKRKSEVKAGLQLALCPSSFLLPHSSERAARSCVLTCRSLDVRGSSESDGQNAPRRRTQLSGAEKFTDPANPSSVANLWCGDYPP